MKNETYEHPEMTFDYTLTIQIESSIQIEEIRFGRSSIYFKPLNMQLVQVLFFL